MLGALVLGGVILAAVLYFGSFFLPWSLTEAVEVVVSAGILLVLGIGGWIGWVMVSTPTPESIDAEDLEGIDEEDFELEGSGTEEEEK